MTTWADVSARMQWIAEAAQDTRGLFISSQCFLASRKSSCRTLSQTFFNFQKWSSHSAWLSHAVGRDRRSLCSRYYRRLFQFFQADNLSSFSSGSNPGDIIQDIIYLACLGYSKLASYGQFLEIAGQKPLLSYKESSNNTTFQ